MKKMLITAGALLIGAGMCSADNLLQVLPQQVAPGCASDGVTDYTFAIQMVNDKPFIAMQFDLTLPEGVSLDSFDPIELVPDRFPHTTGRGGVMVFDHEVNYQGYGNGEYTVIITGKATGTTQPVITGNSGDLLNIYYVTDAQLPDGILPIKISNVKLAVSVSEGAFPDDVSCFFYTENSDPASSTTLDLSALDGFMPADVAQATSDLIADNAALCELRLDNLKSIGQTITAANPNCLKWVKKGSAVETAYTGNANVVLISDEGAECSSLVLTDAMPFAASEGFMANAVTYNRDFASAAWQALYLPFDIDKTDCSAFGTAAICTGMNDDSGEATLVFDELSGQRIAANTPMIIKPGAIGAASLSCANKQIEPTANSNAQEYEVSGLQCCLDGTYQVKTDMYASHCYALRNGNFMRPSNNDVILNPFRIFLSAKGLSLPNRIIVRADGSSEICDIKADAEAMPVKLYDLQGLESGEGAHGFRITENGQKLLIK